MVVAREEPVYLIDASSYVYRAFHALPPLTAPDGVPVHAVFGFARMMLKFLKATRPRFAGAVFDAPGRTFRDELFAEYKANRPAMPEELSVQIPLVQEFTAAFGLPVLCEPGVEADDVIATLATRFRGAGREVVVISGDKDLLQIVRPGVRVWDTMNDRWYDEAGVQEKLGVRPAQVVDYIALVGDPVDNIPGVRGIGEVTARRLLQRFGSVEEILAHLDEVAQWRELRGAAKVAVALEKARETLLLSKELARVRSDLDLAVNLERLQYSGPDLARLRALCARLGFDSLLRELPQAEPVLLQPVSWADSRSALAVYLERIPAERGVAAAVLQPADQKRVSVVCGENAQPLAVSEDVEEPRVLFQELFTRHGGKLTAHDLKADLRLAGAEVLDTAAAFDVMVAAYLLEHPVPARLEEVVASSLGETLPPYRSSVEATGAGLRHIEAVARLLARELEVTGTAALFRDVEMPLVGVLARMEAHGVLLDVTALQAMGEEFERRMEELATEIYDLAGGPFNLASPQQLREVLFERLKLPTRGVPRGKTGLSTDVDVLTRLAEVHPLPAKILKYRTLAKLKSTYVDGLLAAADSHARLHTSFNQCVTATGRLSSSDPNLQNIPLRGEEGGAIRACFVAPPGKLLLVADYSQIELRLLAHFSQDPVLCAAFERQEDIHARTAAEVFGVPAELVSREMRRVAKIINFGVLYGMGAPALARQIGVSVGQAQEYIANYFARYSGVRAYLDKTLEQARQSGYVTTILGRRRSVPGLRGTNRAAVQGAERIAVNTPIQGSAADLIKLAMVRIDRELTAGQLSAAMVLQVHDELVFEVEENQAEVLRSLVKAAMENALVLRVPIVVETGIGRNWLEAHP